MNASLKERFRQVDRIPTPWDDAARVLAPVAEPRPRGRIGGVAIAAVLAVTAAVAIIVVDRDAGPRTADVSWLTRTAGSCVERYSPQTLQGRSWAFEGVITAVDEPVGPGATDPGGSTTAVTFDVVRWFWGGSEEVASRNRRRCGSVPM
jgi:hypothetical protein